MGSAAFREVNFTAGLGKGSPAPESWGSGTLHARVAGIGRVAFVRKELQCASSS
jgi:hypothetical protein